MGNLAREAVGLKCMDQESFVKDKDIQNWAMNKYMELNYKCLLYTFLKYKIPKRGGIRIGCHIVTQSGLLAAAHLVGASEVIEFINSKGKEIASDGNGVPLTKYLELNGFELIFANEK